MQLQETQGIAYGLARVIIGWSQALLLAGVLMVGASRVFSGEMSGPALTTFVFYTNFVTDASFDVGDQVIRFFPPSVLFCLSAVFLDLL